MIRGEGQNVDRPVYRELRPAAHLFLHHNGLVQRGRHHRRCPKPPLHLPLHPPVTREQRPKILELPRLGQTNANSLPESRNEGALLRSARSSRFAAQTQSVEIEGKDDVTPTLRPNPHF